MTEQHPSSITLNTPTDEIIRIDKEGFHYRGQFIADAGEAHRLMAEFLRQNTKPKPQGPTDEELRDLWSWAAGQDQGPWPTQQHCFASAVLARWGCQ